jgi:hypothetical protein
MGSDTGAHRIRGTRVSRAAALRWGAVAAVGAAAVVLATPAAQASQDGGHHWQFDGYAIGTPAVDRVTGGPWTLAQGDPSVGGPYSTSLPTFAQGGSPTVTVGGVTYPNVAIDPSGSGAVPYPSGTTGTPGPLPGYCGTGGPNPESGAVNRQPAGTVLPMQPYYFPFITANRDGHTLTGYFDYRPKDTDEAVVAATSTDNGRTWHFAGEALESNQGICANGDTNDDGQGHAFVMRVPGNRGQAGHGQGSQLLYTLGRPTGDALGVGLLVHTLHPQGNNPLAGLPASEPVGEGGTTTVTVAASIPQGPTNNGVTLTVGNTNNFEMPGRFTVDGATVTCSDNNGTDTTFTGCSTTRQGGLTVHTGDAVAAAPVVPASAQVTTGLVAPDGIISTIRSYPGAPRGSAAVLYTEKITNYYTPTTTTAAVSLPAATIPVASSTGLVPGSGSVTVSLGTTGGIQSVTCTGGTATTLTGCTGGTGAVAKGSQVGAPGAAVAPYSVLAPIGEGKNKPKSLFGNNEDYTVVRAAYTYDGVHFTDLGQVSGLNNPTSNDNTTLRWVGSRGTVVTNPDGSYGLFLSGAYASDGDSDAFDQIFYSSSRDGQHWSAPQKLLGTDYTFGALASQHGTNRLGVSGYYSGRVYDPTVVVNRNGSVTMVFAGYSTPKPLPGTGTVLGTNPAAQFTVAANQPALYRTILSVNLTPKFSRN